jgi:hypothetical protein
MNAPEVYVVFSTLKDGKSGALTITPDPAEAERLKKEFDYSFGGRGNVQIVSIAAALIEHASENY